MSIYSFQGGANVRPSFFREGQMSYPHLREGPMSGGGVKVMRANVRLPQCHSESQQSYKEAIKDSKTVCYKSTMSVDTCQF